MSEFNSVFAEQISTFLMVVCVTFTLPGCDDLSVPGTGSSTPPPKPSQSFSLHAGQQEGMGNITLSQSEKPNWQKFQISNLRKLPNDRFEIDWRRTSASNGFGAGFHSLILRFPSQDKPVDISLHIWDNQDSGKISGHLISFGLGGTKQQGHGMDRGCEIFIANVIIFDAYKLSNSITVGGASELTPIIVKSNPKPSKAKNPSAEKTNQFAQKEPAEKEPVPETELSPLPASLRLKEGLYLYAQLSGNWIPIKVIGVEAGEKVKVHWLGFNDAWDTTLERNKLRVKTSELELLSQKP